ncbi:MAG: GNAT family N-acetyltransferase [Treponema sp.]|jgi:GNAT superfamily N-acetyltransferase|nr:GNAT family N-acetyltransferase [Treponema sp.]
MFFELTRALIDEILFCMEDQNRDFLLDTRESKLINIEYSDIEDDFNEKEERFIEIPEWCSSDGFFIMEQFASGRRNSVIRDALTQSLEQGKGVFRAFKDVLNQYPEMEKRWFVFKEREMKRRIVQWYNGLRESWDMEKIGFEEPEETQELILEDFMFRDYNPDDATTVAALHRVCVEENPRNATYAEDDYRMSGKIIVAEAAERSIVGYSAILDQNGDCNYRLVVEVHPEYRGLGLGSELCDRMVNFLKNSRETGSVYIDVPIESDGFSRYLIRSSFSPVLTRYVLSV